MLGEITVGDFVERFAYWPSRPSAPSWRAELKRLLEGAPVIALIHDPRFAWIVYREGDLCFIQQKFSLDGQFSDLLPRETKTEDGDRISQWSTTIQEIQRFLGTGISGSSGQ